MAIGDDSHGFSDMKSGLSLHQASRANSTGNIFGSHLPLAPASLRSDNFPDTHPETQHHFQTTLDTSTDHVVSPYQGFTFTQSRDCIANPPIRHPSASATFTIHGLGNPSNVELEWSASNRISADQRAKIERYVRDVLGGADCNSASICAVQGNTSGDDSRRPSWTHERRAMTHRPVLPQAKGRTRGQQRQMERQTTPEDMDETNVEYVPLDIVPRVHVRLGDKQAVLAYYDSILRSIQQLAVKSILKAWIAEIEPKKQKNFPYNHKTLRPKWWPPAATQYREPDHLQLPDRILVTIAIIQYVQAPAELGGSGLKRLEEVAANLKLVYDTDKEKEEKPKFRKALLKSLFELAKAEERFLYDDEDPSYTISLPQVTKYEKPNKNHIKKRKINLTKDAITDSQLSTITAVKYDSSNTPNGLPKPGSPESHDARASTTAPNTPSWSHHPDSHDSGVDSSQQTQGHQTQMMHFSQAFEQPPAMASQYSLFDGNAMHSVHSSPESAYPSSTTSVRSMHMPYPHGVSMAYSPSAQGMPIVHGQHDGTPGMIYSRQTRPEDVQTFMAMTDNEERNWAATPATYIPPQPQHYAPLSYYNL